MSQFRAFVSYYLAFLLGCNILTICNAQSNSQLRYFTMEDGLPGNTIYDLKLDEKGYLWIATENGLSRFDGMIFKNFQSPIIRDIDIVKLYPLKDHVLFSNLSGELFVLNQREEIMAIDLVHPDLPFHDFAPVNFSNDFWLLQGNTHLYKMAFDQKKYIVQDSVIFKSIWGKTQIFNASEHTLWVNGNTTCFKYNSATGAIDSLTSLPKDQKWIPEKEQYAYLLKGEDLVFNLKTQETQEFNSVLYNLHCSDTKRAWLSSVNGVQLFDDRFNLITDISSKLGNTKTHSISTYGDITWLGTDGKGLIMHSPELFQVHKNAKGQDIPNVIDITADEEFVYLADINGDIHLMSQGEEKKVLDQNYQATLYGVEIYNDRLFSSFFQLSSFSTPNYQIKLLLEEAPKALFSNKKELWVGMYWKYLQLEENKIHFYQFENQRIYALAKSVNEDRIWLGTTKGLYQAKLSSHPAITCEDFTNTYGDNYMSRSCAEIKAINPGSEVLLYHDVNPILYEDRQSNKIPFSVVEILVGKKDEIWVATKNAGIFCIANNQIQRFFTDEGLIGELCNDIRMDKDGTIWVATNKGLSSISNRKEIRNYGLQYPNLASNILSVYPDEERIWVGSEANTFSFFPDHLKFNPIKVPRIEKIKTNGQKQDLKEEHLFSYDENHIQLEYSTISYTQNVQYAYRLKGLFDEWRYTASQELEFFDLNPGKYSLEIKTDRPNSEIASIHFVIEKPFWEKWWFLAGIFTVMFGLVFTVVHLRIRKIRREEKEKSAIHSKMAQLELRALQAQMNPHFISNALGAIQYFILKNDIRNANRYLSDFAQLMRLILESSKEKFIPLRDEIKQLTLYVQLEQLRFKNKFSFDIRIDKNIDVYDLEIPTMMIQPTVENAINHGLQYKKEHGQLDLSFRLEEDMRQLKCVVEDNGVGRIEAEAIKRNATNNYRSRATQIMQERQKAFAAFENMEIRHEIEDRKDSSGACIGTRVTLYLGLNKYLENDEHQENK